LKRKKGKFKYKYERKMGRAKTQGLENATAEIGGKDPRKLYYAS